jgi:hypothetical protein
VQKWRFTVLHIIQSDTFDDGDIVRGEKAEKFVNSMLCIRALQVKYACTSKAMSLKGALFEKRLNLIRVVDNGLAEASYAGQILESYESLPGGHVYFFFCGQSWTPNLRLMVVSQCIAVYTLGEARRAKSHPDAFRA